jgi:hypothetical protein
LFPDGYHRGAVKIAGLRVGGPAKLQGYCGGVWPAEPDGAWLAA